MGGSSNLDSSRRVLIQRFDADDPKNKPKSSGSIYWLFAGESLTIGRSGEHADIEIDDSALSRAHLKFAFDGDVCRLEDLQSANGTYHNGNRIRLAIMKHGDRVRAGETEFAITIVEPDSESDSSSQETDGNNSSNPAADPANLEAGSALPKDHWKEVSSDSEETGRSLADRQARGTLEFSTGGGSQHGEGIEQDSSPSDKAKYPSRSGETKPVSPVRIKKRIRPVLRGVSLRLIEDHQGLDPTAFSRFIAWIRKGQRISVGTSAALADWQLPANTGLADAQFLLSLESEKCWIVPLSKSPEILVNGKVIRHQWVLEHQDRIQAGHALFVVSFSNQ